MTRLIIGSAHRVVPSSQLSGFLYIIDLESRSVLKKTEGIDPPFRDFDINPRGGMRGMRGIAARSGEVALANYSSIFFFDPNWNLTRVLSHPVCSSIHELILMGRMFWLYPREPTIFWTLMKIIISIEPGLCTIRPTSSDEPE